MKIAVLTTECSQAVQAPSGAQRFIELLKEQRDNLIARCGAHERELRHEVRIVSPSVPEFYLKMCELSGGSCLELISDVAAAEFAWGVEKIRSDYRSAIEWSDIVVFLYAPLRAAMLEAIVLGKGIIFCAADPFSEQDAARWCRESTDRMDLISYILFCERSCMEMSDSIVFSSDVSAHLNRKIHNSVIWKKSVVCKDSTSLLRFVASEDISCDSLLNWLTASESSAYKRLKRAVARRRLADRLTRLDGFYSCLSGSASVGDSASSNGVFCGTPVLANSQQG